MDNLQESPLLCHLEEFLAQFLPREDLLLAVSAGADSMAMLRGMLRLQSQQPRHIAVAHFNHRLRGEESDLDAHWLAQQCAQFDVECLIGSEDVEKMAKKFGTGIEETARNARYDFFQRIARERGFTAIAVAHTRDDQVETVLHHLLRGTGIAGLRGMPPLRELQPGTADQPPLMLARPLLLASRRDVMDYLNREGQDYRQDRSNNDPTYTRNRVRNELLPLLESSFNPRVRDALSYLSRQATELQETLDELAENALTAALIDAGENFARLSWEKLEGQPRHLIRECYALLWKRQSWPRRRMNFEHYDRLAEITLTGGTATLPGKIAVERRAGLVVLRCDVCGEMPTAQ